MRRIFFVLILGLALVNVLDAQTVTYYFNSLGATNFDGNATSQGYAVDGSLATSAADNNNGHYLTMNGNTCPGTDLGTITAVELRVYFENNYDVNNNRTVYPRLTPVFGGVTNGSNSPDIPGDYDGPGFPAWTSYFDITNDANAPATWTWTDVQNLDCILTTMRPQSGQMRVYMVEIRVSYSTCSATTPPTPSIVSSACGSQDLEFAGTPPAGVEWYWQTSATGTSTANNANPYTVSSDGTYYLRAYNTAGTCWATGAASVSVTLGQVPSTPAINDTTICSGDIDLKAYGSDNCVEYRWYDASTGGTLLNTGAIYSTNLVADANFYVEAVLPTTFSVTPEATNSYVVDHVAQTGDDRSGIAITSNYLYVVGDNNTVRFDLPLSSGVTTQLPIKDGLFSDLSTGNLWTIYDGSAEPHDVNLSGYIINSLRQFDESLVYNGTTLNLSMSFMVGDEGGIYAGPGFVIIQDGDTDNFYHIDLSTGTVTALGIVSTPSRTFGENWATWGIAEFDGCDYSVLYVDQASDEIVRLNLTTGVESTAASFSDIGDMTSITASPWENRWYFHHESTSQWTGIDSEIAGYCDASITNLKEGCTSARDQIQVTVLATPLKPDISAFPAIISSGDISTLTAGFSGGTLNWYDDNCGGNVFDTGASVEVTPPLTITYYAAVDNGVCQSVCDTVVVTVSHPCHIDAMADGVYGTLNICAGDVVDISASGGCDYLMDNSFDDGVMGIGWESNANPQFDNPCVAPVDGTTYLWIGDAATFPRDLITQPYAVTDECQICFDFVMATQGQSTPCEGPDEMDEGISLQWSIDDGTTWVDITYFCPDGNQYATNAWVGQGTAGGGTGTPFNVWDNYCFNVPAAAASDATKFRFHQEQVTNYVYDHWGLDNVEITCPTPGQIVQWSHGPTELDPAADVTPGSSTTYTVILDDGLNFGNSDTSEVHVHIIGTPNVTDDQACAPGDAVTLEATGSGTLEWYDAASGGNLVYTGTTYNIASLLAPATFYVAEVMPSFSAIDYKFDDDMEGWTASNCSGGLNWAWNNDGGNGALFASNPAYTASQMVISPSIDVSSWNGSLTIAYEHKYNTEATYDEGVVAYRLDGGAWQQFVPSSGYTGTTAIDDNPFNNCNTNNWSSYSGAQNSYVTHSGSVDVSTASTLELGFAMTSDYMVGGIGWYISEVSITGGGVSSCPSSRAEVHANISDMNANHSTVAVSCFGNNDGQATAVAVDGLGIPLAGIYNFNWASGENTSIIQDLEVGTYPVTISDAYGCEATTTATVTGPSMPSLMVSSSGVSGDCNIESPDEWVHIVNGANDDEVIASVFDAAGGNDLFLTEAEATIYGTVQYYNSQAYLPRVVRVTPSVQGAATVRIYFSNAEFAALQAADPTILSIADLAVTKCDDGAGWSNCVLMNGASFSVSPIGTGYYAEVPVTSFSKFYIHKDTGWALPIELLDFEAVCLDEGIDVRWSTSTESNNDYFVLERSYDLKQFEYIAEIKGSGNSNEVKTYQYEDYTSDGRQAYYRLLQVDYDGKMEIHKTISSNCEDTNKESIKAYQSESNTITIETKITEGIYELIIVDNTGKVLVADRIDVSEKYQQFDYSRTAFIEGMYFVSIRNSTQKFDKKVVIRY